MYDGLKDFIDLFFLSTKYFSRETAPKFRISEEERSSEVFHFHSQFLWFGKYVFFFHILKHWKTIILYKKISFLTIFDVCQFLNCILFFKWYTLYFTNTKIFIKILMLQYLLLNKKSRNYEHLKFWRALWCALKLVREIN